MGFPPPEASLEWGHAPLPVFAFPPSRGFHHELFLLLCSARAAFLEARCEYFLPSTLEDALGSAVRDKPPLSRLNPHGFPAQKVFQGLAKA